MNTTFIRLGTCEFQSIPINDFFRLNGEIFLKLNDTICLSSFNIKTLERASISDRTITVEHLKLKSRNSFVLRISYSWGEDEPEQEFDSFEHAWEKACHMAVKEAEISYADHQQEIGLKIEKAEECQAGLITLHYNYDNTYCYYSVGTDLEIPESKNCTVYISSEELLKHLMFWCNGCGDLHCHGKYDIQEENLPDPLKYAYHNLWREGAGCLEYIVEYDSNYYLAIENEYDVNEDYVLFRKAVLKIINLLDTPDLCECRMIIGNGTEPDGCNGIYVLVPAQTDKEKFNAMEQKIVTALNNE